MRWGMLPAALVVLAACSSSGTTPTGPSAARTERLCPGSLANPAPSADGLPPAVDIVTSARATQVLAARGDELRSGIPGATSVAVGPGFGQAWRRANGRVTIVAVHDYGLVVHLASPDACPTGPELHESIDGVPIFFAT